VKRASSLHRPGPKLSVIVVVYNMRREAPRTLFSLSAGCQEGVGADQYEVIVVDNGSTDPLDEEMVRMTGPNFRYLRIEDASPSPAGAINRGAALSTAPNIALMIDGARMATPGVIVHALEILELFPNPIVSTIALHLGPEVQFRSMLKGYDKAEEDRLLDSIGWPAAGYRLFEIGALAPSSNEGWFAPLAESNLVFMPRPLFDRVGGMDERFAIRGGGIVNLDFYNRVCEQPETQLFCLLGEATFHQLHGGVMTNLREDLAQVEMQDYLREYERIRDKPFARTQRMHMLYGESRPEALSLIRETSETVLANR
jgi:glycosyltransferase involved in cell wall biosynthesis